MEKYGFESLKGKDILITGVNGAIGRCIADAFMQCGANVHAWAHRKTEYMKSYADFHIVDLTQIDIVEKAFSDLQQVDCLVNCAGYTKPFETIQFPQSEWVKSLEVNLTAPFVLSKLVAQNMITHQTKGSIINITSIGSLMGFPKNPAYAASKGGLRQMTKALACDFAPYGIRVNNIAPGYVHTKMTARSWNDEVMRRERTNRTMMGRWAEPEDIVGSVLFLASDMSVYITGQDLVIDGGWTAKGL